MIFDIHIRIDESLEVITISGAEYYKGDKGDDFIYEDFTPAQLEALKVKGDPFLYSDFTPAQIAELQQPATDAVTAVNKAEALRVTAETTRVENEQGRVTAEGTRLSNEIARENSEEDRDEAEALRLSAEITRGQNEQARITAEGLRVDAESTRQTNTATAITNANNAATNANTKAGLADTAANNANEKATLANNAAILANEKAGLANTAATNATNVANSYASQLASKVDKSSVKQATGTSEADVMSQKAVTSNLALKEATANKQNSLTTDGTGTKFPTVDAVNGNFASQAEAEANTDNEKFMTALRVFQNFVKNATTYAFSTLNTTSKTITGAINELFTNKANKTQEAWITPTLLNGHTFNSSNPLMYRKNQFGTVEFKGEIISNGNGNGNAIFNLPAGYRPLLRNNALLVRPGWAQTCHCEIQISQIAFLNSTTASTYDFSQVRFIAE